jgi:hypothetical protein
MNPLHSESIYFFLILMRAYSYRGMDNMSNIFFSKALAVLEYHWGCHHPLQITIYSLCAFLMIENNKKSAAMHLIQSALSCCLSVLGPNHIVTAETHTDLGKLQVSMGIH